ncbi:MAG TPA: DUF29 domain-containing protein [Gemmataceae bacterium]|nr:DUF29 domain-containing protein [Gemmataceae bacterium]
MVNRAIETLPSLYEADETAWLEAMAELIRERRYEELDYQNLCEYLTDMARRDRREVRSRLTTLIAHVLKWTHQPRKRTRSWRGTIVTQRQELVGELGSGVLRNHAETVLADAYADAVERAAEETGIPLKKFPAECPYRLDELLSANVLDG